MKRSSHVRGELKTKVKPLIEMMYEFAPGESREDIAANRALAEDLLDHSGFYYKVCSIPDNHCRTCLIPLYHAQNLEDRKGLLQNPLIQRVVNMMWFQNKNDEGVVFSDYFNPIPIPALALVLTAVRPCVIPSDCILTRWLDYMRHRRMGLRCQD